MMNVLHEIPHIFVISHERSGTHIAIDAVRNNFPHYKKQYYVSIDRMLEERENRIEPEIMADKFRSAPRVVKTHMLPNIEVFFDGDGPVTKLVSKLILNSKCIYIYRDGRDVMCSLYNFWSRTVPGFSEITFTDMLKGNFSEYVGESRESAANPISYWKGHVQSWLGQQGVLALSFEEFLNDYERTIIRISDFMGIQPVAPLKPVIESGPRTHHGKLRSKLSSFYKKRIQGIELTSVYFDKGSVGGHRAMYSEEDLAFFDHEAGNLIAKLGYPPRPY